MDIQPTQTTENPISSTEKCKLIIFLIITLGIVAYLGLCVRILFTAQYTYPTTSACEK